ncbi:ABC transporter ATPase [Tenacibaculum finnmarkense]|uniref:ABC transporter ATPase n=1 Tax=Tenacibaculum finnmarkense genomovar ulcerans TaxID=2781388 RepID=A0A2I2MA95_9FLAO|nr:ABC transporter ATPase [Tenacibaculum finnmarkense]MBE7632774.1 ABC transporter ATPase [Tenacibaculum finnmarkense genomovar ulcerans]MBE7644424.1 ABC transporter ATPase [Tenacibaculum finnmarkense genomovar ulcerans]MBE7648016.1 ABC transporter ATPase [Tenacibaculum finnmarkense genomovar ulcerans]MBE7687994.1 ABC transporter ATPase [Tenacibaculum finnmarkense genomovar ulcerans]MBE7697292.1 ABC transporter ATPase [Tenacibaculum finnmarkense genomovar ulcerans]
MFTEYNNLPSSSRVWVYQADREFNIEEVEYICAKAILFIDSWTRHGADLKGSFTLKHNQFFVLGVDESVNSVSGCSIDASVRFIKELEKELSIDLMDKMNVSFKDEDRINIVKLPEFQQLAKAKKITSQTVVFNNMVNTKEGFETNWEVTADKSWHKQFLV